MESEWLKLVRLELGSNVVNQYTSRRGFLEAAPPRGNLLRDAIGELREALREEIELPNVYWAESASIEPHKFRVICGISDNLYDGSEANVLDVLAYTIRQYAIQESPTPTVVKRLMEKGNAALLKEEYLQALTAYDKAYYWAMMVNQDVLEDFITTVYNVGYIYYLNNKRAKAIRYCSILQEIVERDDYPDPTIRYRAHMFYGNVLWADGQHLEALNLFQQAAEDVSAYALSPELQMLALWNVVCASFSMKIETEAPCRYALIALRHLIAAGGSERYSWEGLNQIASLYEDVAEQKIEELESERQLLVKRCSDLEKRLSVSATVGVIFQHIRGVLLTFSACLPKQITVLSNVGNMLFSNIKNSQVYVEGRGAPKALENGNA